MSGRQEFMVCALIIAVWVTGAVVLYRRERRKARQAAYQARVQERNARAKEDAVWMLLGPATAEKARWTHALKDVLREMPPAYPMLYSVPQEPDAARWTLESAIDGLVERGVIREVTS
jgi:hypothetical protein